MKILLRYRDKSKGPYKYVKCACCGQRKIFSSFRKAKEYAGEREFTYWRATQATGQIEPINSAKQ